MTHDINNLMRSGRPESSFASKDHFGLPILIDFLDKWIYLDILVKAGVTCLDINTKSQKEVKMYDAVPLHRPLIQEKV